MVSEVALLSSGQLYPSCAQRTMTRSLATLLLALIGTAWINSLAVQPKTDASSFDCSGAIGLPLEECQALAALYITTGGSNWHHHDNWLVTEDVCGWQNVWCEAGHVTSINLPSNNLTGVLPPEIGDLTALEVLALANNHLVGEIPSTLGNLSRLRQLWLSNNLLDGSLPAELGSLSDIEYLDIMDNLLDGPIPSSLGQLTHLQWLLLAQNQLTGPLPSELGDLSDLQVIDLIYNQLDGPIPPAWGNLNRLQYLSLGHNQLVGTIPPELGRLSSLEDMNLGYNHLVGSVPSTLGDLVELGGLNLEHNQLSGPIPSELGKLPVLESLLLYENQLSGNVPAELGQLTYLKHLDVHGNPLIGPIPTSLTALPGLTYADFSLTHLCVPNTPVFLEWLSAPGYHATAGILCSGGSDVFGSVTFNPRLFGDVFLEWEAPMIAGQASIAAEGSFTITHLLTGTYTIYPTTTAISSSLPVSRTVASPPGATEQTFVVSFDLHNYFMPMSRRP